MMWYEYLGGRKAYQALLAAGLGLVAWFTMPEANKNTYLFQFLLYWAGCFGIYGWSNIKEHQLNGQPK